MVFGHANRLADESRAAGVPEAGSEAAHKFILSAQYDGEGGKLNADLLAKPGVDRLQTICIAQCGTFTAGAFQRLCASAALTKDRTLDEFLAIDVSTGLQLLQSALGLPGAPEPCNLAPPPTDPPKRSEGKGRAGSPKPTSKRKRGRPADTDAKEDKRIYEAWKTGQHKTQADCDHELGLPAGGTYAACERHRKRLDRRNKRRRTK